MNRTRLFLLIALILCFAFTSQAQVINGSFENASGPDLSNWSWTCDAVLTNTAPPGGGSWSLFVEGGNTQSCWPGYAYQKIPTISNGQTFILTGWALATSPFMTGHHVGIYFGKINSGTITLQAGDTTSNTSWTPLSVQSSYALGSGDTAVVVLFGGLVGGPVQANGIFDLINLQQVTNIETNEPNATINIYPNPASREVYLTSLYSLRDLNCKMYNIYGQLVREIKQFKDNSASIPTDDISPGTYVIHLFDENNHLLTDKLIIKH